MANQPDQNTPARQAVGLAAREHHGRLLALLIRDLRDFQLAEDCLQDAIESALTHWGRSGPPDAPDAWLLQVARRKAIDRLRQSQSQSRRDAGLAILMEQDQFHGEPNGDDAIPDERLRLIFTCCHPALDITTSVALSLRTLCGLTTPEIARAFVVSEEAMAQRLVRGRQKISKAAIPYEVPEKSELHARLQGVLGAIYFTFNEGYAATAGSSRLRVDLCEEAIRLARLVQGLLPEEAEATGLLALLLLTHARAPARASAGHAYIPLEEQDRSLWNRAMIEEGDRWLTAAMRLRTTGVFQLQAAVSAIHSQARNFKQTRWREIILIYRKLHELTENPAYLLNQAVALSYDAGPEEALRVLAGISGELGGYQPFHAATADIQRRAGNLSAARAAYGRAIDLSQNQAERRYLEAKLAALPG